jgi:hypothetical protein
MPVRKYIIELLCVPNTHPYLIHITPLATDHPCMALQRCIGIRYCNVIPQGFMLGLILSKLWILLQTQPLLISVMNYLTTIIMIFMTFAKSESTRHSCSAKYSQKSGKRVPDIVSNISFTSELPD